MRRLLVACACLTCSCMCVSAHRVWSPEMRCVAFPSPRHSQHSMRRAGGGGAGASGAAWLTLLLLLAADASDMARDEPTLESAVRVTDGGSIAWTCTQTQRQ